MNVLETDRLTLRWINREDALLILAVMNEPAFIRYVSDRGLRTADDASRYIVAKMVPGLERDGFGMCAVRLKPGGTPIGTCGLFRRDPADDVEIGFAFLRDFWGHGFAYEAAAATMAYGRDVLKLARIVAATNGKNTNSIKLLEKLGMRFEDNIFDPVSNSQMKLFSWEAAPAGGR
jgi:RimJ/RimL family protein N-acetyltransferase